MVEADPDAVQSGFMLDERLSNAMCDLQFTMKQQPVLKRRMIFSYIKEVMPFQRSQLLSSRRQSMSRQSQQQFTSGGIEFDRLIKEYIDKECYYAQQRAKAVPLPGVPPFRPGQPKGNVSFLCKDPSPPPLTCKKHGPKCRRKECLARLERIMQKAKREREQGQGAPSVAKEGGRKTERPIGASAATSMCFTVEEGGPAWDMGGEFEGPVEPVRTPRSFGQASAESSVRGPGETNGMPRRPSTSAGVRTRQTGSQMPPSEKAPSHTKEDVKEHPCTPQEARHVDRPPPLKLHLPIDRRRPETPVGACAGRPPPSANSRLRSCLTDRNAAAEGSGGSRRLQKSPSSVRILLSPGTESHDG
uniref:Uncharacterized protein n=1 Tax=Chromera velia CCMP2878 TaxID=1169474 RepID=A0A0G4HQY5_9ALVE|eukprot:Cvel_30306.t1-p1 / transcript=Cvel_30306.t1 / gene=Cvel_30306 / organism=Chromera_velia_CCMP2878 / gene_product=hypothetical protein / transcript_product=hypothetical protein / location=Cvel_scaffold4300:1250-3416(+) / protein_length=358 / sequence_SO=supercontig / SO=protein_coding / is_pseudo=false